MKRKEESAVAAAESWLKLVDEGKYVDSWKAAAQYFKEVVTQEQWEQAIQRVRKTHQEC
jgi:hypothetical protein